MNRSKPFTILLIVTIILFFLSAAIALPILCRPYYYWQIDALDLVGRTGFDYDTIRAAYDDVMDYLLHGGAFRTGALEWSSDGFAHFADCRILFHTDFTLAASSAVLLGALYALRRWKQIEFVRFLGKGPAFWAFAVLAAFFLVLGLWALADFNSLFRAFHAVLFPGQTNWLFDPDRDEIIRILPDDFWARTGAVVLALCIGGSGVNALVCEKLYRRRMRRDGAST